jgi:uncharacterized protein YkwD
VDYWLKTFGYPNGCPTAENIYNGWGAPANTARAAVKGWLNSTPHRTSLLRPDWTDTAIAVNQGTFLGHDNSAVWVNLFGRCP